MNRTLQRTSIGLLAGLGLLSIAAPATAEFVELRAAVERAHTDSSYITVRVYAIFSDDNDYLYSVHGDASNPLSVQTTDPAGFLQVVPATGDVNTSKDVNPALYFDGGPNPDLIDDSWITIGVVDQDGRKPGAEADGDSTSLGNVLADQNIDWATFNAGGALSINNGAWYVTPDDDQGQASQFTEAAGVPWDNAVLVAQLTVTGFSGYTVSGTMNLTYDDPDVGEGEEDSFEVTASFSVDARTRLVPSDFNGDKRTDVLMFREDKQKIAYYDVLGVDDVTYVEVMSADLTSWNVLGYGDFNDDGRADVAIQRTDKQKLAYYWFEEDGTPRYQQIINADLSTWNFLGIGDFNGDGRSDLLIQNGPQTTLAYYSILDEAPFIDYDRVVSANLSNYDIVGITDMDDNGKDDIVFWKNNKTNLFYYTDVDGSGNPLYTSIWAGPLLAWDIPAVGDFDGNGSGDLALLRTDQLKLAYYSILEDGSLDYTEIIQADLTAWNFLGAGDYDGDGRSDLLIQNALETTLAYYSPVDGGGVNYARILGADLTAWTIIP